MIECTISGSFHRPLSNYCWDFKLQLSNGGRRPARNELRQDTAVASKTHSGSRVEGPKTDINTNEDANQQENTGEAEQPRPRPQRQQTASQGS